MLATTQTLSVNLVTGVVTQTNLSARNTLNLTLVGSGSETAANMRAGLYRRQTNGTDGTLVASCSTFAGPSSAMVGSLSLNTTELMAAFAALQSVRQGEKMRLDFLVWDASPGVLAWNIWDHVLVMYENDLSGATTGTVNPITGTTTSWGSFKIYNGKTYLQSVEDGLWYEVMGMAGTGGTAHPIYGETGIAL